MNTRDEKTGGSAFPVMWDFAEGETGMTLRDWFAGQALPEVMNTKFGLIEQSKRTGDSPTTIAARVAYEYADALLKARTAQ